MSEASKHYSGARRASPLRSSFWPRRYLGLALALICSSSVFALHIYLPPASLLFPAGLIIAGFVLLWLRQLASADASESPLLPPSNWNLYLGLVACALAFYVFPYPYKVGLIPLALGWLGWRLLGKHRLIGPWSHILIQLGIILILCAALLPVVFAWAARVHDLLGPGQIFGYAVGWLLRLMGQPVQFLPGGSLFLRTFEDPFPITITAEKLLPVPLALFGLVWSIIVLRKSRKHRLENLLLFWLAFFFFAVARVTLLLIIMLQRLNPDYFWNPWALAASTLLLGITFREPHEQSKTLGLSEPDKKRGGPAFLPVALGALFGAAAIAGFTFRDPGSLKSGRLMINEHGSDWEWTTEPLDTTVYNEKTTYNYYCLAEFLKYYYDVKINQEPISPQTLRNLDVLILKIPTEPYAPAEIDAIVDYVRGGGGLWVIGDHTNVFGSSSFYNPLLRRLGYSLNYTSTHDLKSGNLSLYRKPSRFAHPSVLNLPPYLFATSCSMNAPFRAESAILGYGLRTDHLDYSQKNFFPDRSRKLFDMQFGLFMQQAAGACGKGRLLIYTDSTTFSNFFIFIKGKPELVLGTLDWLNRRPRLAWLNNIFLIISILALAALIYLRRWHGGVLAAIILGAALSGWLTDQAAKASYPLPPPKRPIPIINFEREHSNYFLPTLRLVEDRDKNDMLTFYVWTQRVGAVPRQMDDFVQAVAADDPLVMIDPDKALAPAELSALSDFLNRGGKLLLLNTADNPSDAPARLLDFFGLKLHTSSAPSDTLHTLTLSGRFFPLAINKKFASVSGGEVFLKSDQGDIIGAAKGVGKGRIYVLSCGHLFRNSMMGQTSVQPDEGLKALYRVEFDLIKKLLE